MGVESSMMFGKGLNPEAGDFGDLDKEDERFANSNIINLLHMNPEQHTELAERVARTDHSLLLASHPFYDDYHGNELRGGLSEAREERNDKVKSALTRFATRDPLVTPATVVFEELPHLAETSAKMSEMLKGTDLKGYIIPTVYDNPLPIFSDEEFIKPEKDRILPGLVIETYLDQLDRLAQTNWPKLIEIFTSLGVENLYVGGKNLLITDKAGRLRLVDDYGKQTSDYDIAKARLSAPRLYACVPQIKKNLERHFKVKVAITSPNTMKEFRNISEDYQANK